MNLTRKQKLLLHELECWHAMLAVAEDIFDSEPRSFGLCYMWRQIFHTYNNGEDLPYYGGIPKRMWANEPRRHESSIYWWPLHVWAPRIAFIKKMIRLIEVELNGR